MPSLAMLHSPDPPLRFDEHQFAGRRVHAVSAESELSFSDLDRIHIFGLKGKRRREYIPAFAASDEKLRKVLATAAWQYCGGRRPIPDFLEGNLAELNRLVAARDEQWRGRPASDYPKSQLEMWQRHVFTTGWGGGYLQVRATIAYLSWRLGWPSNKIAEQLHMTPWNVRIILYRLSNVARKLGFATFERNKTFGMEKGVAKRRRLRREAGARYRARRKRRLAKA